jgi:hypothetical protein
MRLLRLHVVAHARFGAGALAQQVHVGIEIPVPAQAEFVEGRVEGIAIHFLVAVLSGQIVDHDQILELACRWVEGMGKGGTRSHLGRSDE